MAVQFGPYELEHPIMNGAGVCKSLDDVKKLSGAPISAILAGSFTKNLRSGNPGNVWAPPLNSLGMPNRGIDYIREVGPEMRKYAHDAGKLLWISVAGDIGEPVEVYGELGSIAFDSGADVVELNAGCSNLWSQDGKPKEPLSYDPAGMQELLAVAKRSFGKEMYGVKLSPLPVGRRQMAEMFVKDGAVKFITGINTFPGARLVHPDGTPYIGFGKGLGGYSGEGLKAPALGQIYEFMEVLQGSQVAYVGAGGISSGQDVVDYLNEGAVLVQVVSAYAKNEDVRVFERILKEYADLAIPA